MANVNELNLTDESLGLDYDNIPEERGETIAPLQPGTYVFDLPTDLSTVWSVIKRNDKQLVQAVFHKENALIAELANETRPFSAWINNHAYPRGPKGSDAVEVSDMQYLLRVLDPSATPNSNPEFVAALSAQAGKKFKATVHWSAYCNDQKPAFYEDPETHRAVEDPNSTGCGETTYQNAIPRDPETQEYQRRFSCACNAVLTAFPKLRNFQSVDAD